jgi:hypothetical protein
MQGASAVLAESAVPAVAIARDPRIEMLRDEVNAWREKQPGNQIPAGQRHPDTRPGVCAAVNPSGWIDRLHEAHRVLDIHLGKAPTNARVMNVQQFDVRAAVPAPEAGHTSAAQVARAIVEHGKLGHVSPHAAANPIRAGSTAATPILASISGWVSRSGRAMPTPFEQYLALLDCRRKRHVLALANKRRITGGAPYVPFSGRRNFGRWLA